MPSMYTIYDHHPDRYDALVDREDHAGALRQALASVAPWDGAVVVEAGIGTGRVTRWYAHRAARVLGFDRAEAMLDRAAANLQPVADRVRLAPADHRALPVDDSTADVFVEGWAFGHAVMDAPDDVEAVADALLDEARRVTRPGGTLVLVETLGTNVDAPAAPAAPLAAFYAHLEARGFARQAVRTDYRFASAAEAADLCGFFFGAEVGAAVAERCASASEAVVPEWTGLWHARR